jgi:outer membrane biosynthesis protein TonB
MEFIFEKEAQKDKRKSWLISLFIHIFLMLLALLPLLTFPVPPPGQKGILVNLGQPDVGSGTQRATPPPPAPAPERPKEQKPEPLPVQPTEEKAPPQEEEPRLTAEEELALAQKKIEDQKKKEAEEAARKKEAEEEAKRIAEAEAARKKAEEEARIQAEAAKTRDEIGGLFSGNSGSGQTGKPGNQGDPNGDPNAEKLQGISTGSGVVGGGLGNRGVMTIPEIKDKSQKEGTVVVRVCVDQTGKVISAEYTQVGSTTADPLLVKIASDNSRMWKFLPGDAQKQCGTITYKFKLN